MKSFVKFGMNFEVINLIPPNHFLISLINSLNIVATHALTFTYPLAN